MKRIYLRTVRIIALLTFPLMSGLLVVTKPFVLALFGNKWSGMIPVLQVFCLLGMAQSIGSTVGWIYNSTGRTDLQLRWGIGSGVVFILSIVLGIWLGSIEAVAICYAVSSGVILLAPSFSIPGKIIGMTVREVADVIKDILLANIIMASIVAMVGISLPKTWSNWTYLSVQVPIGILVYIAAIRCLGVKAFIDVKQILNEYFL
jgi:PST family polysaccharide transporter